MISILSGWRRTEESNESGRQGGSGFWTLLRPRRAHSGRWRRSYEAPLRGGLADFVLFGFEVGADGFAVADELFFELFDGLGFAFFVGLHEFAFHEEFALGDLGGALGFAVGELFFLLVGKF